MSYDALQQARIFLLCVGLGAATAAIFDVFRIVRRSTDIRILVNFCDAFFWLFGGVFFVAFLYRVNSLELRFYVFLAAALGMMAYFFILSRYVVFVGVALLTVIKKILRVVLKIILVPISFFIKQTQSAALIVISPIRNLNKKTRKLCRKFIFERNYLKKI